MAEDIKKFSEDAEQISPLSLAYVGDSIYDFFVRDYLIRVLSGSLNKINGKKKELVCAKAQSAIMAFFLDKKILTEEEFSVYRRARNHKSQSHSKNSAIQDYRRATGFEAVLGFLHYRGEKERLQFLMEEGLAFLLRATEKKEDA